ncbi:MAG: UDP-N-acetylmuramoyl-L-alanyl-D-glutamate--2,6-diaminopimelate ligase [Leptospirillia bacterium]
MKLTQLLTDSGIVTPPDLTVPGSDLVSGIAYDSRRVSPGNLFVAIPGHAVDGHDFIADAARAGAICAVVEKDVADAPLPTVRVSSAREALADLACTYFEHPSEALLMIGVTGTNGKTTTAYLIESILTAAGHSVALTGTVDARLCGDPLDGGPSVAERTTPEAPELQALLAHVVSEGATACVMEVSSHALALSRVRGCHYDAAVFTNLTTDHLDFHGTMEGYFEAKRRLFTGLPGGRAVVNTDDAWGRKLLASVREPVTFGLGAGGTDAPPPLVTARDLMTDRDGIRFRARTPAGEIIITSTLVGEHNVMNLLAAIAAATAMKLSPEAIAEGLAVAPPVPGRLEPVDAGQPYTVLVDYAHTPDALARLLTAVRPLAHAAPPTPPLSLRGEAVAAPDTPEVGRVITVFGCGGDRDTSKRAPMGAAAVEASDLVFITSDNPRSESPEAICEEIARGAKAAAGCTFSVVIDRKEAIRRALAEAHPGDVVLIAGKGHETTQVEGDRETPFDDRQVARALIEGKA